MKEGYYTNKYRIKSARRPHWDYANSGFYFVTICAKDREHFFGNIINAAIKYSEIGKIARHELLRTEILRKNVKLDEWIIMPNHIHVIIVINKNTGTDCAVETHCAVAVETHCAVAVETHCNASLPQYKK